MPVSWEVDPERTASNFDAMHFRGLLEKVWTEVGFLCSDGLQLVDRAFFRQFIGSSPTKYRGPEMFPLGYL